jgi:hypothetical protein
MIARNTFPPDGDAGIAGSVLGNWPIYPARPKTQQDLQFIDNFVPEPDC